MAVRIRSGKWHYRFTFQGHEYCASTGLAGTARNKAEAQRVEADAYKLVAQGRANELHIQATPFSKGAEMFQAWVNGEYQEHPNSARRIHGSMASLKLFFGNKPVHAITAGQIEDYKGWRRTSEVMDRTLRNDLHNLSLFFQYAEKHGWRRDNPVRKVDMPSPEDAGPIHVLTAEEERVYFKACRLGWIEQKESGRKVKHGPFLDLHDLGRLMLNQGMRPEEALSLTWMDVGFNVAAVKIGASKTAAGKRTLRLTPESRAILEARRASKTGEVSGGRWVFPSPTRPGRHIVKLNNAHDEVLKHLGLEFRIYDFRHSFATRAAEAGMDVATLAKILGHANLRTVMKYIHPSQAHMDEAMDKFAAVQRKEPAVEKQEVERAERVN